MRLVIVHWPILLWPFAFLFLQICFAPTVFLFLFLEIIIFFLISMPYHFFRQTENAGGYPFLWTEGKNLYPQRKTETFVKVIALRCKPHKHARDGDTITTPGCHANKPSVQLGELQKGCSKAKNREKIARENGSFWCLRQQYTSNIAHLLSWLTQIPIQEANLHQHLPP